jgi:hypothetical protein
VYLVGILFNIIIADVRNHETEKTWLVVVGWDNVFSIATVYGLDVR